MGLLDEPENPCHGTVYKADVQQCKTQRGFMLSIRLNEMKRLSCKGCGDKCCRGWEDDSLGEIDRDRGVAGMDKVEHGKLYIIKLCNISTDWETGIMDDWDLGLVEYNPE